MLHSKLNAVARLSKSGPEVPRLPLLANLHINVFEKSFKLGKGLHWMGPQWFIIPCVFEVEEVSGVRTGRDYMLALLWSVLATLVKWLYRGGMFVCTQIHYFTSDILMTVAVLHQPPKAPECLPCWSLHVAPVTSITATSIYRR